MSGKCPRCHKENTLTVVRKEGGKLKCEECSYLCTDDQTDILFGLRRVDSPTKGISYENEGDFESFFSWFCLKKFKTFEERNEHDKKFHKDGDIQLGMFPVGFVPEVVVSCG